MGRGRPSKKPSLLSQTPETHTINIFKDIVPPKLINDMPSIDRFANLSQELICPICKDVLRQPIQGPCQHFFCLSCVEQYFAIGQQTCPLCKTSMHPRIMERVPRLVLNLLAGSTVLCRSCKNAFPLERLQAHEDICRAYILTACKETVVEVLEKEKEGPLNGLEETWKTFLLFTLLIMYVSSTLANLIW